MNSTSPRKLHVLKFVADYFALTRAQIQKLIGLSNDRVMRAILQVLCVAGLLQKTRMQVVSSTVGTSAPVYFLTRLGAELVAAEFGDDRYLRTSAKLPNWTQLHHLTELSEIHIRLDKAIERLNGVEKLGFYGEWDEVNPHAEKPHDRFRLFTLIREKPSRLVCAPDAVFALAVGQHSKCYFVELDRGTSGVNQIASSKTPGYAAMSAQGLHRRFFDTTAESFTVLHISPTLGRRDLLRRAISTKESALLHRFAMFADWTAERSLIAPIFYGCDGEEAQPLIRLPSGGAA